MTATGTVVREHFDTSRRAEFFQIKSLQSATGQPPHRFGAVIVKELLDNALDAAETAGRAPVVNLALAVHGDDLTITVTDNGPGMAGALIDRILDFDVLVSDKAAYRSPTRGLQGNALKTVLGIPVAFRSPTPVVIEALGVRHSIMCTITPAGELLIDHQTMPVPNRVGTTVTVTVPAEQVRDITPDRWAQGFALFNPHAAIGYLANAAYPKNGVSYKPTVAEGWRKQLPTDPTSAHHYDRPALEQLVFANIAKARNGGRDLAVGEFVRSFAGLSATFNAKAVCAWLDGITRLSDLEQHPEQIAVLLAAMQAQSRPPNPKTLGAVPEDHYRAAFADWYGGQPGRCFFKRVTTEHRGIPFVVEVALAETDVPGGMFFGTNYSAAFGDPLSRLMISGGDKIDTYGVQSFLREADADPDGDAFHAAAVHLITPAAAFLDRGKTALAVDTPEFGEAVGAALWSVSKVFYREKKARERSRRAASSYRPAARQRDTLKDCTFHVMVAAIADASANGTVPFPTRNLYYSVRALIQEHTDDVLTGNYFSQTLVVEWEQQHGRIPGHYRDPRGTLLEPHTGTTVPMGTREVDDYEPPRYLYDKILYVEKQGFDPIFAASHLGERYDMAIISGKGQPVEAVRTLLETSEADCMIFVLHDADPYGYSIARTLAEETARMPEHNIEVIDLGLTVADALAHDPPLLTETFQRNKAVPAWMPPLLSDTEQEWFQADHDKALCTRVELNALKTGLIGYIEAKLAEHGADAKIHVPTTVATTEAESVHRERIGAWTFAAVAELLDLPAITETLIAETTNDVVTDPDEWITTATDNDRAIHWRDAVSGKVQQQHAAIDGRLKTRLQQLLGERLK